MKSSPLPSHLPRNICPTICAVCGRKASGYHYEVPSCNGCKTFFRRTVLSQKKFSCTKNGTCITDLPEEFRLFCRACRFGRCVSVGMNPLGIRTSNDLEANDVVQSIVERRSSEGSYSQERSPSHIFLSTDAEVEKLIDKLLYLELTKRDADNEDIKFASIRHYLSGDGKSNIKEEASPGREDDEMYLYEMLQHMFAPFKKLRKTWTLFDLLSTIDYARTFSYFHNLEESDQLILIKHGVLLCFNLTQAFLCYECRNSPTSSSDEPQSSPLVKKMQSQVIDPIVRNQMSKKEYVLLKALLLCNSSLEELSDQGREMLQKEREQLSRALLSHCLSLDPQNGPARYAANLALTSSLEVLTRQQKDFLLLLKMTFQDLVSYGIIDELTEL